MTAKTKARIRVGATLVPLLLGLVMIVVGVFGMVGDAGAVARPAAGQFHIGGTDNFPMFSNLVLDFTSLPDKIGTFTGSINMTHANAAGNNVALTLNSLTQTSGGFTITSVMPSGGMATGTPGVPNPTFPASSTLTVNYLMSTPFAPPNDQLKGTHTLNASTISCWPPVEDYMGGPSSILRVSDNAFVGVMTVPYHSTTPLPKVPLLSPGHLILFGLVLATVGFAVLKRRSAA